MVQLKQTARVSHSVESFLQAFIARLHGLAASQNLLVSQNWGGVLLEDLVRQQLRPFATSEAGNFNVDGPPLLVTPDAAQTLGLALHELATNASKYGSLSVPGVKLPCNGALSRMGEPAVSHVLARARRTT